jgi:hypothetical protein
MQFEYGGDNGCPIVSWFRERLRAVKCCFDSGLPEASLTLLYSGIDTLGLLAAPPDVSDATRATFIDWCEKYLVTLLKSIDGKSLMALDLYAARCGVLHTSRSVSRLGREGVAHEVCYQFQGQSGVNLGLNAKLEPAMLDIAHFAIAFTKGGTAFIRDLNRDPTRLKTARARAQSFFRWGTLCGA